nr:alpha-latrocrustotoxin precursor [Latrodectus tredecimguttatus]
MKGKRVISKREMSKADQCTFLSYQSVAYGTLGDVAGDVSSIEGADLVATPIAAGGHLAKGATDAAMIAMDCSSIPFDEIKQQLNQRFNEVDKKLQKGAEALENVTELAEKTYSSVEKMRVEMREGFNHVIATIENANTKQIITGINQIIQYFNDERENINNRQKEDYVAKLQEPASGNFLLYLRKSRTSEDGSLHSLLFKIINQELAIPNNAADNNAIRALFALFYGTQTFISIMFYLVKQYSYLADYHYQNGNLAEFNSNFDHMKTVFQDFKFTLIGINTSNSKPLVNTVLSIIEDVKNKRFIRNLRSNLYQKIIKSTKSLLDLREKITKMDLPIIEDTPKSSVLINFREKSSSVPRIETPILKWTPGTVVKYAIQYEQDGKYSKISKWSNPITVQRLANPYITIDKDRRNRLVFRQFGNEKPELISILDSSQNEFRDIHRDLYNAAQMPYKETALGICRKLIDSGAQVGASFEMGRKSIHASATAGNDDVARLLLAKNNGLLNVPDKNGYTPLHIASERKNNDFVKFLLEKGADVNVRTFANELTPLHLAARQDFTIIVKTLMEKRGIDVNAKERAGFTPLHLSITSNSRAARTLINETPAGINIKSNSGLTPLHLAVLQNNLSAAKVLVKSNKKVKLNEMDNNGMTPLHYASMLGNLEFVKYFTSEQGIDVNAKTKVKNWTPLHLAILFKKFDVAQSLLQVRNIDISTRADQAITPLHLAAATGNSQIVKTILNSGAVVDQETANGFTALHLAIMNPNTETPQFLIAKGANINAKTNDGSTPLHFAAALGKTNIFQLLMDKGANIKAENLINQMPIHEAVVNGHLAIVKMLIEQDSSLMNAKNMRDEYPFYLAAEKRYKDVFNYLESKGADVNEKNNDGNTLLHLFSINGEVEVVQFLIQNGADFRLRNKERKSFFDLAVEFGHAGIVGYAIEENKVDLQEPYRGKTILYHAICDSVKYDRIEVVRYFVETLNEDQCSPLQEAAAYAHLDLVKYFVQERGINPTAFNNDNQVSPLCIAIVGAPCGFVKSCDTPERLDVVEYLVDKTPDINKECDTQQSTPVSSAVYGNKVSILNYLIRNGADPNKKVRGDPPLFIAAMIGQYDIVKSLVEQHKIDVNTRNKEQFTPLHAAASNDHIDVVKYLIQKGADVNAKGDENLKPIDLAGEKSKAYLRSLGRRFFRNESPSKSFEIDKFNAIMPEVSMSGKVSHDSNFIQHISSGTRSKSNFNSAKNKMYAENSHVRSIDVNGALLLLDFMVRVFSNRKMNYAASISGIKSRSNSEAQAEALILTERFEHLLNALIADQSIDSLDFSNVHSRIYKAIINGNPNGISEMLCSYAKEYSELDPEKIEKLLQEFETLTFTKSSEIQINEKFSHALFETCGLNRPTNVLQIK